MIIFRLDELLFNNRMSQSALCKLTGIRPGTINDIYHNMAERVNLEHINKICTVLGCDLHDLIQYTPDKKL